MNIQKYFAFILLAASCSKVQTTPNAFVKSFNVDAIEKKETVAPDKISALSVKVTAVLDKNLVLEQDFFYGADVQYSSIYDKKYDLYTQSSSQGHTLVRFRIVGDELQLIADNKNQFPSDVNHPEQLISRFKILSQTDKTLTVSAADSSVYLAAMLGPATSGGVSNGYANDHWVRSFEFVKKGSYFLQETSVVLKSGEIVELMESIFPRENLKASSNFKLFQMNPDHPVGASSGPVARYRFLGTDHIFNGENKLSYAAHFDIPTSTSSIDWYVTPNIPEEDLAPVQEAVEGWNRYFKNFRGIQREVVKFKGRLPSGIHLGDPRFNVINWDSRLVAGAAYESQAFDPSSGKQSHSIIYMPAAWIKIGMDYWKNGEFSDIGAAQSAAQAHPSRFSSICYRDLHEAAALLASGSFAASSEAELKKFGIELLKQTLFHEVGHALGLAHNFKGSLSYQLNDTKTSFSTSIMDYNDFEIERAAFSQVDSADGPQLEYDRQAMSTLYNNGADVVSSDPVLPACNDNEADNEIGGIDPLCTRYDLEADPTQSILDAQKRIVSATMDHQTTLSDALLRVAQTILSSDVLTNVKSREDFDALSLKVTAAFSGALNYYYISGRGSLGYTTRTNLKSLYKFADVVLPSGFDARLMRERVYSGLTSILSTSALPEVVSQSLAKAIDQSLDLLKNTSYLAAMPTSQSKSILISQKEAMSLATAKFAKDENSGFALLRSKTLAAMARHPNVSFFFGRYDQTQIDYEMMILGLLADASVQKNHGALERIAAVKSLVSFMGRKLGDAAVATVLQKISLERDAADNSDARDLSEMLLKLLQAGPAAEMTFRSK
jgi:hypothetical protein